MNTNIDKAKAALAHLYVVETPKMISILSRDCFWYSPVLKARMGHLEADFVICPHNETDVIEILRVCYAHDVPDTTRGAGTGKNTQSLQCNDKLAVQPIKSEIFGNKAINERLCSRYTMFVKS